MFTSILMPSAAWNFVELRWRSYIAPGFVEARCGRADPTGAGCQCLNPGMPRVMAECSGNRRD